MTKEQEEKLAQVKAGAMALKLEPAEGDDADGEGYGKIRLHH